MTKREPLPGWGISYTKFAEMDAGILHLSVDTQEPNKHLPKESQRAARWWIEYEGSWSEAWSTLGSAQLAAEDAARALVADMAAALGGTVAWPTEAPPRPLDCGDNSCMSPERSRGGMRTNGGCCCHLEDLARAHERRAAWWRRSPNYERSERDRLAVLAATEVEAPDA